MFDPICAAVELFELEVQRGRARGEIRIAELVDAYLGSRPSLHEHASDPAVHDLRALEYCLKRLPPGICACDTVLLRSSIPPGLDEGLLWGADARYVRLGEAEIMLEAPGGLADVVELCGLLCLLTVEAEKVSLRLGDRSTAAGLGVGLQELLGRLHEDDDRGQATVGTDGVRKALLVRLSHGLGVDLETLVAADEETRGGLLLALCTLAGRTVDFMVRPEHRSAVWRRGEDRGPADAVRSTLRQLDLQGRPLFVLVAQTRAVIDTLSPYVRELRSTLAQWAQEHPEGLTDGSGLARLAADGERSDNLLYGVLEDFLRADARLLPEKREAERTVGIYPFRAEDGTEFTIVDAARLDLSLADPRLQIDGVGDQVLILVDYARGADLLEACLEAGAGDVQGVGACGTAVGLAVGPGGLLLPDAFVSQVGENLVEPFVGEGLGVDAVAAYGCSEVVQGPVLTAKTSVLHNAGALGRLTQRYGIVGFERHGVEIVHAFNRGLRRGWIDPGASFLSAFVASAHPPGTDERGLAYRLDALYAATLALVDGVLG